MNLQEILDVLDLTQVTGSRETHLVWPSNSIETQLPEILAQTDLPFEQVYLPVGMNGTKSDGESGWPNVQHCYPRG